MGELRVTTTTGQETALAEGAVAEFKASLRGEMLCHSDAGYDAARTVFNAMIDRHPGVIVPCTGVADVISAVNFARTHQLLVAVRGGGHNVVGNATCDGGLVIDLSRMKGIRVDSIGRTARAEGGVTWGEFDRETQVFGLASTGGIVPTTGIAGLTLGGGHGYLMRRFGLACDNLLSADIVTADGQLQTASATQNADLFWGVRGGGGNFGVVTSLEYRLHSVGPRVLGGLIIHPLPSTREVLRFYREFAPTAPDELTVYLAIVTPPGGERVVVFLVCYNGPLEKGEHALRPLRAFGSPVADTVGPTPYTALQALVADTEPPGLLNYWKSSFIYDLSDDAIDTMVAQFEAVPSPWSHAALEHLGGAEEPHRRGRDGL
jgi:hypothetical protein